MRRLVMAASLILATVVAVALVPAADRPHDEWAYEVTGITQLQRQGLTGDGVRIAILDTGLDESHPAFVDLSVVGRAAFLNDAIPTDDEDGHGTHVTGIVAGNSAPQGFRGVAPGAEILVYKAFVTHEPSGENHAAFLSRLVQHATAARADIICIAGSGGSAHAESAARHGILVVAAAGTAAEDAAMDDVVYPARVRAVIAVGAVDHALMSVASSPSGDAGRNDGMGVGARIDPNKKPEVSAPGEGIRGPRPDGQWARMDGTSAATAIVCGGLALVLEAVPEIRGDESRAMVDRVKYALMNSTVRLHDGPFEHHDATGYGLFNAARLLEELQPMGLEGAGPEP